MIHHVLPLLADDKTKTKAKTETRTKTKMEKVSKLARALMPGQRTGGEFLFPSLSSSVISRPNPPRDLYLMLLILCLSDWPRIFGIHTQLFSVDIIRLPEFPLLGRRNWTCEKSRLFSFCPPTSRFLTWPKTKGILRKNWRSPTWTHKIQIE